MIIIELFKLFGSVYVDNNEANKSIQKTDTLAEKLGKGFISAGKVVATGAATIGAAVVAVGGLAVKSFGEFEQTLNKVSTIADPSVKSIDIIKKEVLALSNTMGIAAGDINEAMYQAISATGDTANALKYVEGASKLAKGGFTDVSKAMDGVTKTMNAYGMEGEAAFSKVSDMLIQTQNLGITTVDELAGSLYNVIPTAASLGIEFDQVSAAMATMTSMGTPTSVATTQLKSAMSELSKSGTKASEAFKEVSGVAFQEFIAQGGNMSEAMQLLGTHADNTGVGITDLFGSLEAGAVALALTGDGAVKFNESLEAMGNSAGSTQAAYDKMSQGVNASFGKLVNAGKNVLISLGDKLAPLMVSIADWIIDHMPEIEAVIEGTFEVVGDVIGICVKVIEDLMGWLGNLLTSNEELGNGIQEAWENIRETYNEYFGEIKELLDAFIDWCMGVWDKYGEDIVGIIANMWEVIESVFNTAMEVLKGIINFFTALFKGDMEGMSEAITDILNAMWEGIKDLFTKGIEYIFDLGPKMFQAGCDLVQGLWDGWNSIWTGMQDFIQEKVDWMVDKLTFWDNGKSKLESGINDRDGSHANGLSFVPFDGYMAETHLGEAILTKEENIEYRQMKQGITTNNYSSSNIDTTRIEQLLEQLLSKLDRLPKSMRDEARMGVV